MADLKALFAKKKDSSNAQAEASAPAAVESESTATGAGSSAGVSGGSESANDRADPRPASPPVKGNPFARKAVDSGQQVQADDAAAQPVGQQADSKPAPKSGIAGLKIGNVATRPATDGVAARSDAKPADGKPTEAVESLRSQELTLADLEQTEDAGTPPAVTRSSFPDEVPATAPLRELPEELTPQMKMFVELIDGVYQIVHEPDIVGNVIKSIMIELKANPQFIKLVAPDDVRMWIRAMRENMGLAKIQKAEKKAKTASRGRGSARVDQDMLDDLKDLGIDLS